MLCGRTLVGCWCLLFGVDALGGSATVTNEASIIRGFFKNGNFSEEPTGLPTDYGGWTHGGNLNPGQSAGVINQGLAWASFWDGAGTGPPGWVSVNMSAGDWIVAIQQDGTFITSLPPPGGIVVETNSLAQLRVNVTNVTPTNKTYTVSVDGVDVTSQNVSPGEALELDLSYTSGPKNVEIRDEAGRVVYEQASNGSSWYRPSDIGDFAITDFVVDDGGPSPQVPPPPIWTGTNDTQQLAALLTRDNKTTHSLLAQVATNTAVSAAAGGSGGASIGELGTSATNIFEGLTNDAAMNLTNNANEVFGQVESSWSGLTDDTNSIVGAVRYDGADTNAPGIYNFDLGAFGLELELDANDSRFALFDVLRGLIAGLIWLGLVLWMWEALKRDTLLVLGVPQGTTAGQSFLGTNANSASAILAAVAILAVVAAMPVAAVAIMETARLGLVANPVGDALEALFSVSGSEFVLRLFPAATVVTALIVGLMFHFTVGFLALLAASWTKGVTGI